MSERESFLDLNWCKIWHNYFRTKEKLGLLEKPEMLNAMKRSAAETGRTYTLERMIERFTDGICHCLFAANPLR